MANLKEKANTYRLPMTSTPENLEMSWSRILTFGSKVLLAGYYYEYKIRSSIKSHLRGCQYRSGRIGIP